MTFLSKYNNIDLIETKLKLKDFTDIDWSLMIVVKNGISSMSVDETESLLILNISP